MSHKVTGVIAWVLGDRSAEIFKRLWQRIKCWHSYFYVTDGYPVYPCFMDSGDRSQLFEHEYDLAIALMDAIEQRGQWRGYAVERFIFNSG